MTDALATTSENAPAARPPDGGGGETRDKPLAGQVAVVTGASGLLGEQHCIALSAAGAKVVATDVRRAEAGAPTRGEGTPQPYDYFHAADVCDKESLQMLRQTVLERFGRLDILVNNAALNERVEDVSDQLEASKFENVSLATWRQALEVNVTGVFLCCQVLGGWMAQQERGSIINIASTYGVVAPDQALYRRPDGTQLFYKSPAYPTTKGAVLSLTKYLAAYWGRVGVRVNALSPGGVHNKQDPDFVARYAQRTPLGRMAEADDYQGAIVFLAGDASRYMTGANLIVDGGWTIW